MCVDSKETFQGIVLEWAPLITKITLSMPAVVKEHLL